MTITRLTTPLGITSTKVINVPDEWSSGWFRNFIKIWLQSQDVGNVSELVAGSAAFILGSDGSLTVNASEGTSGYVLTSQGPGLPAHWAPGGGGGGSGTVTSVALADGSTSPIYTISGSPVTTSGTLTATLATQSSHAVFVGPNGGSAAQPTFRALVVADLPSGYLYSNLSGAPSIPTAANPTASVGLSVVNGSAATFMRSDAAPALSQSIAPTWTGLHTFSPASGRGILVQAVSGTAGIEIDAAASSFASLLLKGGLTGTKSWELVADASSTAGQFGIASDSLGNYPFQIGPAGGLIIGPSATGGDEGLGTINVSGGYFVNGAAIGSGSGTGANIQIFTQAGGTSQTYTLPVGAKIVRTICIGGGGGGGSGAVQASGSACSGGGGGGGGGVSIWDFQASALGSSVTIAFSSTTGGAGGTSVAAAGGAHAGTGGTNGATAEFGAAGAALLVAYGGTAGGGGGLATTSSAGAAGNGATQAGTAGGAGVNGNVGGVGGGANVGVLNGTNYPMCGGGAGGGISTTPGAFTGALGGATTGSTYMNLVAGTAGSSGGGVGGNGNQLGGWAAASGGGGGGSGITTVSGGKGGNGSTYGSGGGGGGSCLTTATSGVAGSGAGGAGGPAAVICIAW